MMKCWSECASLCAGLISAGLFDEDGLLLEGHIVSQEVDPEHAAVVLAMVAREAHSAGHLLALGPMSELQLAYDGIILMLRPLRLDGVVMMLGLAARDTVLMGRARWLLAHLEASLPALMQRPRDQRLSFV